MKLLDLEQYLTQHTYPGRGIVLGRTPDNDKVAVAYFIMGRSENSRNRIFEETEDGIRTRAFDESKMTDPSLIIYHPVRILENGMTVVTNGDQTDTIRDHILARPLLSPRPEHPGLRAGRPQLHPPHLRRGEARLHL